ncbi:protein mono-ADP-ribosyltransferase PARP12-like [Rana temporaria]|uniref:protein mono-ADP-ribosyltransferase PARP12-like n=1 Tax=Rana temporaria TaxID=8407 RepID=UPI001AADE161|nr:protein mono-ADP-ribosyltransferase PARP12-like [Rana temporaria]
MSDPAVTAYLTKLLCVHGGRLERNRLPDLLSLPEEQIEQILQDEPLRFPQSSELVLARTPLRICTRYLRPGDQEDEEGCPRLHLCRHYLRGQCPPDRRPRCRFSHNVESEHNRAVLRDNELSGLNEDEIKVLLFQNDNQLLPEKCQQYKQDSCDQGEDCTRLHVCSFFAQDGCNRRLCRRSHNLLNSKLLLTCSWLNQETIQNFQMLCVLKSIERQQAPREGSQNEAPRGARGMSRGRGRGRPGYRRRAGSQDLLDSRRRDRSSEAPLGSHPRWRSSSRPPSQCRMGQRSGDEDHNDSDGSSDHGRYPKSRLDNLMDDWFTPGPEPSGKAQVRSVGVTPPEGIRSALPNKGHVMSSRADKPLQFTPLRQTEPIKSRLTSEFSRTSYNTQNADYNSSNAAGATPVPFLKYHPHAPYPGVSQARPEVPPRIEHSVSHPTSHTKSSSPTLTTLQQKSVTSLTSPQPSTISSTSSSSRQYPTIPSKPNNALISSLLNRQVQHSTGGSSSAEARVSPSPSNHSEITSTKRPSTPNQKTHMELGKVLDSSMARLSIAPLTPSKAALYTTTEMSSIAQPKPATSGHMGASSSSYNAFVEADPPSRKLQANVKPIIKTDTTGGAQYSQTDKDFELFCQSLKATNSTASKPQPSTTIPSVSPGKSSLEKTPEICLDHIWKHCSLEGKCPNMHYYLPYRWQVFNGIDWDDLPNKMEDIERAFCDPIIDRYRLLIDFQAMKSGSQPVRRLTTPSSVTQPPEYVLTTEWCWYWKNESGTWTEYGQLNTENMSATIQSSDLETIYLADPNETIPFTAGNQTYIIDCREMKQRNLMFKTEREVRRRPKFLDFQNVIMLKGSTKSSTDSVKQTQSDPDLKNRIDPPQSRLEVVPENRYTKIIILQGSSEFTSIVAMFSKTVSNHTVKNVWRVENSNLWMLYNRQKDQMKKKLANTVDEHRLFHGTNPADIDVICSQNFDQKICGTNGIAYGLGSYFARDASYSHKYSIPTSAGTRTMFLAHVLVGDFTEGNPTLLCPPQKYGSSQRYDSCVDNKNNPSVYVVFEKDQVYPTYILEYEERKTPCFVN